MVCGQVWLVNNNLERTASARRAKDRMRARLNLSKHSSKKRESFLHGDSSAQDGFALHAVFAGIVEIAVERRQQVRFQASPHARETKRLVNGCYALTSS